LVREPLTIWDELLEEYDIEPTVHILDAGAKKEKYGEDQSEKSEKEAHSSQKPSDSNKDAKNKDDSPDKDAKTNDTKSKDWAKHSHCSFNKKSWCSSNQDFVFALNSIIEPTQKIGTARLPVIQNLEEWRRIFMSFKDELEGKGSETASTKKQTSNRTSNMNNSHSNRESNFSAPFDLLICGEPPVLCRIMHETWPTIPIIGYLGVGLTLYTEAESVGRQRWLQDFYHMGNQLSPLRSGSSFSSNNNYLGTTNNLGSSNLGSNNLGSNTNSLGSGNNLGTNKILFVSPSPAFSEFAEFQTGYKMPVLTPSALFTEGATWRGATWGWEEGGGMLLPLAEKKWKAEMLKKMKKKKIEGGGKDSTTTIATGSGSDGNGNAAGRSESQSHSLDPPGSRTILTTNAPIPQIHIKDILLLRQISLFWDPTCVLNSFLMQAVDSHLSPLLPDIVSPDSRPDFQSYHKQTGNHPYEKMAFQVV
jgi:hypothetical protein